MLCICESNLPFRCTTDMNSILEECDHIVPLSVENFDASYRLLDDIAHTYRRAYLDRGIVHTVDLAGDYTYVLIAVHHVTVAVEGAAPCGDDACSLFLLNRCNIYWEAAKSMNLI